ncbi:MAG: hypothetical protein KJ069_00565 [Anaerolineae bacterium]|nr:hypothetical protein [Anaerolineae bacterium]
MKIMSKTSLYRLFLFGGLLSIVFGFIHISSGLTSDFTSIIIGDAIINILSGLLFLVAAWLLSQGKQATIIVVVLSILASIIYAFVVGRGVNFVAIIVGAFLLWQLYGLKRQGELIAND